MTTTKTILTALAVMLMIGPGVNADHQEEYAQAYTGGTLVTFPGVDGGDYEARLVDGMLVQVSGAYSVNGGTFVDFCGSTTIPGVPAGAMIDVRVDSFVDWLGTFSCGVGQISYGTVGAVELEHLS